MKILMTTLFLISSVLAYGQKTLYQGTIRWVNPQAGGDNPGRLHTVDVSLEIVANYRGGSVIEMSSVVKGIKLISAESKDGKVISAGSLPANVLSQTENGLRFHLIYFDTYNGSRQIYEKATARSLNYYSVFGEKEDYTTPVDNAERIKSVYNSNSLKVSNIILDQPTVHNTALIDYFENQAKQPVKDNSTSTSSTSIKSEPSNAVTVVGGNTGRNTNVQSTSVNNSATSTTNRTTDVSTSANANTQYSDVEHQAAQRKQREQEVLAELDREQNRFFNQQHQSQQVAETVTDVAMGIGNVIGNLVEERRERKEKEEAYRQNLERKRKAARDQYNSEITKLIPLAQEGSDVAFKRLLTAYEKLYTEGNDQEADIKKLNTIKDMGYTKVYNDYLNSSKKHYLSERARIIKEKYKAPVYLVLSPIAGYYSYKLISTKETETGEIKNGVPETKTNDVKLVSGVALGMAALLGTTAGIATLSISAKPYSPERYQRDKNIYNHFKKQLSSLKIMPIVDPTTRLYAMQLRMSF